MQGILQQLIERWAEYPGHLELGVSEARLIDVERALDIRLPADLRSYFLAVNGTGSQMDIDMFRFWPLEELRPIDIDHIEYGLYPGCFLFADWSLDAWQYAVQLTDESDTSGPIFVIGRLSPPAECVANSFTDFLSRYLANPISVM